QGKTITKDNHNKAIEIIKISKGNDDGNQQVDHRSLSVQENEEKVQGRNFNIPLCSKGSTAGEPVWK
ncbi:hypothetical protein LOAG_13921, partial [Loa loa]